MPSEQDLPQDPLNLDEADRAIRINELEEKARELGMSSMYVSDECPSPEHEQFLRDMIAFESGPLSTRFDQLAEAGIELPDPDALDDAELTTKLWEVIHALAARDVMLYHTDHLSDRQLYEHLWHSSLREQTTIMPPGSGWMCHIDLIGGGSDEDIEIGLRYYDTPEQREHWATDFPDLVIPPHEDPPYDRDRQLPRPAREEPEWDVAEDGEDD